MEMLTVCAVKGVQAAILLVAEGYRQKYEYKKLGEIGASKAEIELETRKAQNEIAKQDLDYKLFLAGLNATKLEEHKKAIADIFETGIKLNKSLPEIEEFAEVFIIQSLHLQN